MASDALIDATVSMPTRTGAIPFRDSVFASRDGKEFNASLYVNQADMEQTARTNVPVVTTGVHVSPNQDAVFANKASPAPAVIVHVQRDSTGWAVSMPAYLASQAMAHVTISMASASVSPDMQDSSALIRVLKERMGVDAWANAPAQTMLSVIMSMANAAVQAAGMDLSAANHARPVHLGPIAPTSATATMKPLVTLWMEGASVSRVLQALAVKNTALKVIGEKTATGRASAKTTILYATLFTDASAGQDILDPNARCQLPVP